MPNSAFIFLEVKCRGFCDSLAVDVTIIHESLEEFYDG